MVGASLIHVLMLMRSNPKVGFISDGVLEALIEGHVIVGRSAVSLESSCLPGHHLSVDGINLNLTILGERSFRLAGFHDAAIWYLVVWCDPASKPTS